MKRRAAIVGGGLGGLSAAGHLAREGCEVTLFERSDQLGGKARSIARNGIVLDTGPTLLTLPHLVRDAFHDVGGESLLPAFVELTHQCHYRYADGRTFDAYRDIEQTARSAAALDAREGDGVRRFYAEAAAIHRAAGEPYLEAPFEGFAGFMRRVMKRGIGAVARGMAMGTLDELARRHFHTEALRMFAGRFATYAGASPYQASAAFALIPHLEVAYGVHHVVGGLGALVSALAEALRRAGVRLRLGQDVAWRKEGKEFLVGPSGHEEAFDTLVVNADPLRSQGREGEPLSLSGYVLLLEADVRANLPHHSVLFTSNYQREFHQLFSGTPPSDPTVYVCHPAASDPAVAPQGRSGIYVMMNHPAVSGSAPANASTELRSLCLERVLRAFPQLDGHVSVIGERTPWDLAELGAPGGSIYGFLPHGRFGPFRRPKIRGREAGLFYAGGGTHPGGGVPLVLLSGRFAAQLALEHLRGAA